MERPKKIKPKASKKQSKVMDYIKNGFPILVTLGGARPVYGCGDMHLSARTFDSMRHKGLIMPNNDSFIVGIPQTWTLAK